MTTTLSKSLKAELRNDAFNIIESLNIQEGETIYTDTNYVGNMGTAYVRAWIMRDNEPVSLTWAIGNATNQTLKYRNGRLVLRTGGGGYSRAQHVVDALSWVLFGENGRLKDREI